MWGLVGCCGWGQVAWWARLTCHLTYLRFTTRGAERSRRGGLSLWSRRRRKSRHPGVSRSWSSGGKSARVGEGLAGDAEGGDEADAVWIMARVSRCLGHQGADREVAAQVTPDFLEYQVRGF